jgi:hypothetical protein
LLGWVKSSATNGSCHPTCLRSAEHRTDDILQQIMESNKKEEPRQRKGEQLESAFKVAPVLLTSIFQATITKEIMPITSITLSDSGTDPQVTVECGYRYERLMRDQSVASAEVCLSIASPSPPLCPPPWPPLRSPLCRPMSRSLGPDVICNETV